MLYHSTRNADLTAPSTHAVLEGIAPDGGLYICDPAQLHFDWQGALKLDTMDMAAKILSALLPDFSDMDDIVRRSYAGKFPTMDLTPLVPVGGSYVLELYHGPTSAFKDVALSVLPRLIGAAARAEGMTGDVVILTATSGDTGKAALEGFHDVKGTRIIVFYPEGGVSAVQQAQMATQTGDNVKVCAVRGNFDDAQTGVKQVFAACQGKDLHGAMLSSANSINIGRLAPQVVYYFRSYADLVKSGRIRVAGVRQQRQRCTDGVHLHRPLRPPPPLLQDHLPLHGHSGVQQSGASAVPAVPRPRLCGGADASAAGGRRLPAV